MASDTSLIFNLIAKDKVTKALGPVAAKLRTFGTGVGKAVAGVGAATPVVAAAVTAAAGLAAGATAAGLAVGAFHAAVVPQMSAATEAVQAYEATLDNAGQTEDAIAKEREKYLASLQDMPPATRAFTKELIALKAEHQSWSASLAQTTMPVFARGLGVARALMPQLTPLVRVAAKELSRFVGQIERGVRSKGFGAWMKDMTGAAGPALRDLLATVKNLAVGVGGLLHAFLPVSDGMTGGLVDMSVAFREWATSLEGSTGFARFLDLAREGGDTLAQLGVFARDLAVAFGPFAGSTMVLAGALADIVQATPPGLVTALGQAFVAAAVGMKLWAAATAAWSVAQRVATAVQAAWNAVMAANPVALVILAIAALIAIVVVCYKKFPAFRAVVQSAMRGAAIAVGWLVTAGKKVWGWIQASWPKVKPWLVNPIRLAVTAAVLQIRLIIAVGRTVLGWIRGAWQGAKAMANPIKTAVTTIRTKFGTLLAWFRGLPGRFRAIGSAIVEGLKAGIAGRWSAMVGWVQSKISSLSSAAKKVLGIASPSRVFAAMGRNVAEGMALGIRGGWPRVTATLGQGMAATTAVAPPVRQRTGPVLTGTGGRTVLELRSGGSRLDDLLLEVLRRSIRVQGGDVQVVLGVRR